MWLALASLSKLYKGSNWWDYFKSDIKKYIYMMSSLVSYVFFFNSAQHRARYKKEAKTEFYQHCHPGLFVEYVKSFISYI